jgi:hypothetical protein
VPSESGDGGAVAVPCGRGVADHEGRTVITARAGTMPVLAQAPRARCRGRLRGPMASALTGRNVIHTPTATIAKPITRLTLSKLITRLMGDPIGPDQTVFSIWRRSGTICPRSVLRRPIQGPRSRRAGLDGDRSGRRRPAWLVLRSDQPSQWRGLRGVSRRRRAGSSAQASSRIAVVRRFGCRHRRSGSEYPARPGRRRHLLVILFRCHSVARRWEPRWK